MAPTPRGRSRARTLGSLETPSPNESGLPIITPGNGNGYRNRRMSVYSMSTSSDGSADSMQSLDFGDVRRMLFNSVGTGIATASSAVQHQITGHAPTDAVIGFATGSGFSFLTQAIREIGSSSAPSTAPPPPISPGENRVPYLTRQHNTRRMPAASRPYVRVTQRALNRAALRRRVAALRAQYKRYYDAANLRFRVKYLGQKAIRRNRKKYKRRRSKEDIRLWRLKRKLQGVRKVLGK